MQKVDFEAHNAEVNRVWEAFWAGKPYRVPVTFLTNPKHYLLDPKVNPDWPRPSFAEYSLNLDLMLASQLQYHKWMRFNVLQDREMGLPEQWPGPVYDQQNYYEAAWFGCPIEYFEQDVPRFIPILQDDPHQLAHMELPPPLMPEVVEGTEALREKARGLEFEGRPVGDAQCYALGTDGPFTNACNLRGATEVCLDMYTDPAYYHELMEYITTATIQRLKAMWTYAGWKQPVEVWGFADDSIELLSVKDYMENVYPYHRRLVDELTAGINPVFIHLCGNVERLLPVLHKELGVGHFDLGFPVDLGRVRKTLGPDVYLNGNLHPGLLQTGPKAAIEAEIKRLCASGVMEGGRWICCEGSNVAPGTPVEHYEVMYNAALKYGRYDQGETD